MDEDIKNNCPHVALQPISSSDQTEYYKCVVCGEMFCKECYDILDENGLCPICDNYLYDHD